MSIIEYKYRVGDKVRIKTFEEVSNTDGSCTINNIHKMLIRQYASRDDITIAVQTGCLGRPAYRLTYPGSGLTRGFHIEQFIVGEEQLETKDTRLTDDDLFTPANDADIFSFLKLQ